jgi:hypothetical protein
MYKVMTGVIVAVFTYSSVGLADNQATCGEIPTKAKYGDEYAEAVKLYKECLAKLSPSQNNEFKREEMANSRCKEAVEDLKSAENKLRETCEKNGAPGLKQCGAQIEGCRTALQKKDRNATITSTGSIAMSPQDVADLTATCPAYVAELSKDWKKIAENGQEKLDRLRDEENRAQRESAESMKQLEDEATRAQENMNRINKQKTQLMNKLEASVAEAKNQLDAQAQQLQLQFAKEKEALNALETAQDAAHVKYTNAITKADTDCRNEAQKQVREYLIMANGQSRGAGTAVLRSGSEDKKLQERMITWECNQPSVQRARIEAAREFNLTVSANQKNIGILRAQVANQPKLLQGAFERVKAMKDAQVKAIQGELESLAMEQATEMQKQITSGAERAQKMQLAQTKAQQAKERVNQQQNDLAMARANLQAAGGITGDSIDKPSARTVSNLLGSFTAVANKWCAARVTCAPVAAKPSDRDPANTSAETTVTSFNRPVADLDFMDSEQDACPGGSSSNEATVREHLNKTR